MDAAEEYKAMTRQLVHGVNHHRDRRDTLSFHDHVMTANDRVKIHYSCNSSKRRSEQIEKDLVNLFQEIGFFKNVSLSKETRAHERCPHNVYVHCDKRDEDALKSFLLGYSHGGGRVRDKFIWNRLKRLFLNE